MKASLHLIDLGNQIQNITDSWAAFVAAAREVEDDDEVIESSLAREEMPTEKIVNSLLDIQRSIHHLLPAIILAEDYIGDEIPNSVFHKRIGVLQEAIRQKLEDQAVREPGSEVTNFLNTFKDK